MEPPGAMYPPVPTAQETQYFLGVGAWSALATFISFFVIEAAILFIKPSLLMSMTVSKRTYLITTIPSNVHALVVSGMATYALWIGDEIYEDMIWGKSDVASTACAITMGYMFGDLCVTLIRWKEVGDWMFVFHHLASMFAFLYVTLYGCYRFFAMIRLLAEYSTLFVNFRSNLHGLDMHHGRAYFYNGLMMVFSFTCARMIPLPIYLYCVYSVTGTDAYNKSGFGRVVVWSSTLVLDSLNVLWYKKMLLGAVKVWNSQKPAEAHGQNRTKNVKQG